MAILTDPPEWEVPGTKPPQNIIKDVGWEVGSRPPAPWWNWFFFTVAKSLRELETATLDRIINEAGVPGIMAGPESDRPDSTPETEGRIYIATDTKRVFRDRGNGWDLLNTPEAIGAETPAGAQAKADAAAGAALSAAKAYADEAVAAHAGRTDNPHGVTKSQVGLGNVENYPVASQQEAEAGTASNRYMTPQRTAQAIAALAPVKSVAGRTGAVTLSKSDVGLGNVENYGIATQAEAEAGTATNKYMTPLRVAQAIAALHANRRDNPHQVTAAQLGLGDVLTHLAQILDSRIVDHNLDVGGSNGYYVRFENGLQVCWHQANEGVQIFSQIGALYTVGGTSPQDFLWTYPAAFAQPPIATGSFYRPDSLDLFDGFVSIRTRSAGRLSIWYRYYSVVEGTYTARSMLMAIGRWK